jgi:hypothetical protein
MATFNVSNNSQLADALRSAGSGDRIELGSGTYEISARGQDFHNATITAASGANVSISEVTFRNVSNLTFDGVDFVDRAGSDDKLFTAAESSNITVRNSSFDGNGDGVAFWVNKSDGITVTNTDVSDFQTGFWLGSITDLTVQNNNLSNIHLDGMLVGFVHDALFAGNVVSLNVPGGVKHTDGMQFYNTSPNDPLTNVVIRDNRIDTNNDASHGIYLANALGGANKAPGTSGFFRDITIDHNTVVSGNMLALAVGQTVGLRITDNIVLQDTSSRSSSQIRVPAILVDEDSTGVTITGNTTHKQPGASGQNWQPTDNAEPGWTISNNKIVPLGTSVGNVPSTPSDPDPDPEPSNPSDPSDPTGNGRANTFSFDARGATDVVRNLDFSENDKIVLHDYARNTFQAQSGGNPLAVTSNGSQVTIDSWEDLRELDSASRNVTVREGNDDTLIIDVTQSGAHHMVQILDWAHDYF